MSDDRRFTADRLCPEDLGSQVAFYFDDASFLSGILVSLSASFFMGSVSNVIVCVQNGKMNTTTAVPPSTPIRVGS